MKNRIAFLSILLAALLFSCTNNAPHNLNEKDVEKYLNEQESIYESMCIKAGKEVWEYYSDSSENSMSEYKNLFAGFLNNDSLIQNINEWNEKIKDFKDTALMRRLELWKNVLSCAQVDFNPEIIQLQNKLESLFADYPSDNGTGAELENSVRELIQLRNKRAIQSGYENYAYMVLQNTGIDIHWFENLIRIIAARSLEPYKQFIREQISDKKPVLKYDSLRQYIIQAYRINEEPVIADGHKEKLLYETLSNIGIDIHALPIELKITNLPPGIGGFGNCIHIPDDFRVVAMKELSFYHLLHEIGHGLHWTNVAVHSPMLKGYEWCTGNLSDLYCEAMAETIAQFSQNGLWLEKNGFDDRTIGNIKRQRNLIYPVYLRLRLVNTLFEIELYKHPEKDPAVIKKELYAKYLLTHKDFSNQSNLIMLSFVSYPIYEQNYLIADIIAWQIHEYLKNHYGEDYPFNPNVGEFLKRELWRNGELRDWKNRILTATGKELDVEGYLKEKL